AARTKLAPPGPKSRSSGKETEGSGFCSVKALAAAPQVPRGGLASNKGAHHMSQPASRGRREDAWPPGRAPLTPARREREQEPTSPAGATAPAGLLLAAGPARRRRPGAVLAVVVLGSAMAFIDATIVNISVPSIAAQFPAEPLSGISWVLNGYNIVFAA